MKKLMTLVLSLGLVLLGTAPVMAAGQITAGAKVQVAHQPTALQVVQLGPNSFAIPEPPNFDKLSEGELEKIEGKQAIVGPELGGALIGAGVGAGIQMGENYVEHKPLMKDTGKAAVIGAISGAGTVTKEVVVVSKYASGLIEASTKVVIDTAKTAVAATRSFAANVAVKWFTHRGRGGSASNTSSGSRFSGRGHSGYGFGSGGGSGW